VDFEALREKYKDKAASAKATPASTPAESEADAQVRTDYEKLQHLDTIRACSICRGSGIEKYIYNFQERERNCDICDGEGLVRRAEIKSTLSAGGSAGDQLPEGGADVAPLPVSGEPASNGGGSGNCSGGAADDEGEEEEEEEEDKPPLLL